MSASTNEYRRIPAPARISAALNRGPREVVLDWTFTNAAPVPVFVFDRLWRYAEDGQELDPNGAQRFVVDDRLRVWVGAPPLPHNASVYQRIIPFVTRVEPEATLRRALVLREPVEEHYSYDLPEPGAPRDRVFQPTRCTELELLVQYVPAQEWLTTGPGIEGTLAVVPPMPALATALVVRTTLSIPTGLECLRRRVDLPREAVGGR